MIKVRVGNGKPQTRDLAGWFSDREALRNEVWIQVGLAVDAAILASTAASTRAAP
jgi:hypothetical protein